MRKSKVQVKIQNFFFKIWPLLFIAAIWFIFASPYFLNNKVPFASTYQVNFFPPWSAYSEFGSPVKNNAMPDVISQIYPWKHFTIETFKNGQIPLWDPYSFSGTPHLAGYQSAVLSPFNILFFILPFVDAWSILVLLQPLLAGIFMYLLARRLKRSRFAGLVSSISFMFCGFITVWLGYATLGYAIVFLPLAIYFVESYYQLGKSLFLIGLSLAVPLSFFSGHFQISLYFLLTVAVYIVYKFFVTKKLSPTIFSFLFLFFGLLLSMPQLIPSVELYLQALRSGIFQKFEAIPFLYLPTLIAPDFFGNPVTRNDWFGHYAEWNAYIGVLPLMLAMYSILDKKRVQTLFLFIFGIIILLLAFNTPFLTLLINAHIPVLSTSAASRIVVIYSFSFSLLAAYGFDDFVLDMEKKKVKKLVLWLTGFFIIFAALWLWVVFKLFMLHDKIVIARQNLILPTLIFILSSFIILSSAILIKRFKTTSWFNRKIILTSVCFVLVMIIAFDLLRFATKWQSFDPKNLVYPKVPTTQEFSKITGYERALGNLGGEAIDYYGLPSVEGYNALYIKRYGEFIASIENGKIKESYRSVVAFPKSGKYASKAINFLGIRYIIHKISDDRKVWTFPFWSYPTENFNLIYNDGRYQILENKTVFPRAFLVGEYKVISDQQRIIDTMFGENFDLKKEIVLEKNPGIEKTKEDMGSVKITKYSPTQIDIAVYASHQGLLFLSDPFYKGWEAQVDGSETTIYRADYAFRAIEVPKGRHIIRFVYSPVSFKLGVYLGLAGVLFILVGAILLSLKKK